MVLVEPKYFNQEHVHVYSFTRFLMSGQCIFFGYWTIDLSSFFSYINHIHNVLYSISSFDFYKLEQNLNLHLKKPQSKTLLDFYNFLQSLTIVSPTSDFFF